MPKIAGHEISKTTLWIAGGGTGLVLFLWYRHSQANAAAATSTTPTTDPSIDPATGIPYADESGYDSGYDSGIDPATGIPYADESGYNTYPTTLTGPGTFTNNAQWAEWAEQELNGTIDPATLSAALGKYLTGQAMTSDQESLADQAIAIAGYPPVSGPGGYPPAMRAAPPAGTTGGGSGGTPGQVASFSVTGGKGYADFGWSAVSGADNYNLVISGPQSINRLVGNTTHAEHVALRAGKYTAHVRANNHGTYGPFSVSRTFTVS
jgi:hypothetical protein